ncbi:MAG TPA: zinc-binding dehydrogenase [Longimicrobiales bacterium]
MRAALFHEFGGPDVIRIEDVPRPEPGPGEVLVQVKAVALNHLDLWVRRGMPQLETRLPHVGGSDIAGVVAELGPGVTGVEVGTRVVVNPSLWCGRCEWCERGEESLCVNYRILGEHTWGGMAEYVAVPARNLFAIPDDADFASAAAAPLVFLTAWRGLTTRARLGAGEAVLITGASGGVATAAIQIARLLGAHVYAVTTAENVDRVRGLGADVVYDRTAVDFSREVWKDTGKRGVDVVFDSVGQALWQQNLRALARGGRLVTYGATTGPAGETAIPLVFWKQLAILGTTMSNRREFEEVMGLVFSGRLKPVVDVVWPLERAADAHRRLEQGEQFGKVVLTV